MTNRSRPWDIRELDAGDARRLGRVIRRIPTAEEQAIADANVQWRSTDKWTRALLCEVGRLGFEKTGIGEDGRVYVIGVGQGRMILVLTADVDATGLTVQRVTFGRESWTAQEATAWLKQRTAR